MKTKITMIAAFAVLSAGAIAAPSPVGAARAAEIVAADQKEVTLEVTGLKCSACCPKKVTTALQSVQGVTKANITNQEKGTAETVVLAAKSVKVADLIKALKKKGFGATQLVKKGGA